MGLALALGVVQFLVSEFEGEVTGAEVSGDGRQGSFALRLPARS